MLSQVYSRVAHTTRSHSYKSCHMGIAGVFVLHSLLSIMLTSPIYYSYFLSCSSPPCWKRGTLLPLHGSGVRWSGFGILRRFVQDSDISHFYTPTDTLACTHYRTLVLAVLYLGCFITLKILSIPEHGCLVV